MGDLLVHHTTTPSPNLDIINIQYYQIKKIIRIKEYNNIIFHILFERLELKSKKNKESWNNVKGTIEVVLCQPNTEIKLISK